VSEAVQRHVLLCVHACMLPLRTMQRAAICVLFAKILNEYNSKICVWSAGYLLMATSATGLLFVLLESTKCYCLLLHSFCLVAECNVLGIYVRDREH